MVRQYSLPSITFHGLRHTFASYLLTKGVNIKVIQEQLGHATIQETLITYSHVGQDQKKSATELFNFINKKNLNRLSFIESPIED
ncbi:tyrosine-type recombinase/integrase [Lysinibacillus xylanilyticus]|uniref:tyrosine-type recombinase/integrase n=1 Tax=Lysinibacillus xylanilyticus TaxID=582475 RepID=UPI00399D019C